MPVTQKDVAILAGVSRPLVSLVMRNSPHVSPEKREAVLRAAEELGYRRNAHAAQLASRRAMILGLVLNEPMNPVYIRVLRAAEERAEAAGYGVLLALNNVGPDLEREAVGRLLGHRVDGVILVGTHLSSQGVAELSLQAPMIVVGRRMAGVDVVSIDDHVGARLAVEHLVELGHRDIAHVDGGPQPGSRIRRQSYEKTMSKHGLEDHVRVAGGDNSEPGGLAAARRLLADGNRPTAIFASNDLSAIGVLAAARDHALAVPDDLSVVGFDNSPLSEFAYVNLTTIHQPPEVGAAAVDMLIDRITDPSRPTGTRLLKPELIARGTTGAPHRTSVSYEESEPPSCSESLGPNSPPRFVQ
jgi:DNA-binding LacI/PurR family transcriptional regulator